MNVMADQIVITEKISQAKDIRDAVGHRYGTILPAEGHLFDLVEPEALLMGRVCPLTFDPTTKPPGQPQPYVYNILNLPVVNVSTRLIAAFTAGAGDMETNVTLDADHVGLITYALQDYLVCRGAAADPEFILDYKMAVAQMDGDTLVAACVNALRDMCLRHSQLEVETVEELRPGHEMRRAIYSLMLDYLGIRWGLANMPRGIDNVPDEDTPALYAKAKRDAEVAIIAHKTAARR